MGIDINKIIAEATQEENESTNEVLNESSTINIEENVDVNTKQLTTIIEGETPQMDTNRCMASAISAGLGGITFRNHLRSLTEISDKAKSRWKTAGKVGAGALAVGAAGKLAYDHIKGNEADNDAGSRMAPSASSTEDLKTARTKKLAATLNRSHKGSALGVGRDDRPAQGTRTSSPMKANVNRTMPTQRPDSQTRTMPTQRPRR